MLAIYSRIRQLKLGQYLANIFWESFSLQKVKKCIFKGPKCPPEASISRTDLVSLFMWQTEKFSFYFKLKPTLYIGWDQMWGGSSTTGKRGKMACCHTALVILCQKLQAILRHWLIVQILYYLRRDTKAFLCFSQWT